MAKKYTSSNKKTAVKSGTPGAQASDTSRVEEPIDAFRMGWSGGITIVAFILLLTFAGSMDNILEKWTGLLAALIIVIILFASKEAPYWKNHMTPLFFSIIAYIVWGGISTFYAASPKFAIFEFSKLLVALCVYLFVLFFTQPNESGLKKISYIVASTGCFFGIVSIDAASSNILWGLFKTVLGTVTATFDNRIAFEQGIRINGIFGNPNTYAGFMALAIILSLYLVLKASDKKNIFASVILLAINSLAYILAFSMGSVFMFILACMVMILVSEKGKRLPLFLLMVQTAVITFIFAFISMVGLGKTGLISMIPIAAVILNAIVLYFAESRLRPGLIEKMNSNMKLSFSIVLLILIIITGYAIAAFNVSSDLSLDEKQRVMRAIYIRDGNYTLSVDSSAPLNITIESQNNYDLMRHTSTVVYRGSNEQPISFAVPTDSRIVKINFSSEEAAIVTRAEYEGAEIGNIHLNYPILPEFIANRIQNLLANENVIQRTIFFNDGIKLFLKSPVIGRGLGGFENGVFSVQDFFYETKYAHNHYVQVLSDLGIIGLLLFLSTLSFAAVSIIRSRKKTDSSFAVPVLSACTVQMFGQALTDATWSTGVFLGFAAAILALTTIFCSSPVKFSESINKNTMRKVEKAVLVLFAGFFVLLLSGNLYSQAYAKSGVKDFDDIDRLILLDRFEYNDYKVSYLVNAPRSGEPEVLAQADIYAQELMKVESNSIAPYVVAYNFETYKDYDAFHAAKRGIENARSYPYMWIRIFDIFEEYIDPVGAHTEDAADRLRTPKYYIDEVLALYDELVNRNKHSLDRISLSPYNNAFLGKLLEVRATNLYSVDWVFTAIMTRAFDSESAVDANLDGIPDSISLLSGSIKRNEEGLLTVIGNTEIELNLYHELGGTYTFMVRTETPDGIQISMDGAAQNMEYSKNEAYFSVDLPDNADMKLSKVRVVFPSATVIDYITYSTELDM